MPVYVPCYRASTTIRLTTTQQAGDVGSSAHASPRNSLPSVHGSGPPPLVLLGDRGARPGRQRARRATEKIRELGEAELLRLKSGVIEGGDDDEPVAVPLGGLAELQVECLACGGDHLAVREGHLPGEGPGGVGDDGDPVSASEPDWIRRVHVHVREAPQELLHRRGVWFRSVDGLCE